MILQITLALLLAIIGPLGVDIHLSSLPKMMADLHTHQDSIEQSVTLYLLASGISMLIYGPIADVVGRKKTIITGLVFASICNLLVITSSNLETFLCLRFLQGFGGGVSWCLARVIFADLLKDEKLAIWGSYCALTTNLSPMVAPMIGAYIQYFYGWRVTFVFLGTFIALVAILFSILFKETLAPENRQSLNIKEQFNGFKTILTNTIFLCTVIIGALIQSCVILYVTLSPFIFQVELNISALYYVHLTFMIGLCSVISKIITPSLIKRLEMGKTCLLGFVILSISGMFLCSTVIINKVSVTTMTTGIGIAYLSGSMILSTIMAIALSLFSKNKGKATALYSASQLIISFCITSAISSIPIKSSTALAFSYLVIAYIGSITFISTVNKKLRRQLKRT